MKKIHLLFIALCLSLTPAISQSSWFWGELDSVPGEAAVDHSIAVDLSGNTIYTSVNGYGIFLMKRDVNGNQIWRKQLGGGNGTGTSVALDPSGNIYVAGYFSTSIIFGTVNLSTIGNFSSFLIKCDPNGNPIWGKQGYVPTTSDGAFANSVAVDASGNAYLTGYFADSITFGAFPLYYAPPGWLPAGDIFVVKYNTNGNVIWANQGTPSNNRSFCIGSSIAVDANYNLYVGGYYQDIQLGSIVLTSATEPTNQIQNPFLAKYDTNGTVLWAEGAVQTGTSAGTVSSISVDGTGDIYMTGGFGGGLSFGSFNLVSGYRADIFLVKYKPNGNVIWAKQTNVLDSNGWAIYSLVSDTLSQGGGNLVMSVGNTAPLYDKCEVKFGADTFQLNTPNQSATILFHFDSGGIVTCGNIITEGPEDDGDAVGVDRSGQYVYLFGDMFEDELVFGPDTLITSVAEIPFFARWKNCEGGPESVNNISSTKDEMRLYPNPNNGKFMVKSSIPSSMEIYNMLGKKIYQTNLQTNTTQINIGTQPNGMYLYRVITEEGNLISSGKFVIE